MNQKEGLDYFPMECAMDDDIKLVTAEHGIQALAIIVRIYQMIYSKHGYYCEWNEEVVMLFTHENGLGCKKVSSINEILACCMRRGVFSASQYEQNGILTSKKIQENFLSATRRRKFVKMKKAYLLVNVALLHENVCILDEDVDILDGNVDSLRQSRVKYNNKYIYMASRPTLEEVKCYMKEKNSHINPVKFFYYYEMRNWSTNGVEVVDWKAAVDYWETNEKGLPDEKKMVCKKAESSKMRRKKNDFNTFDSRNVSKNEMHELERMLLKK